MPKLNKKQNKKQNKSQDFSAKQKNLENKLYASNQLKFRQISNNAPPLKNGAIKLTKCAMKYALAVSEPFHPSARGVCGIFGNSFGPTQKVSATSRFTFVVGTNGLGFIAISPTIANDAVLAYATNASFAGTNLTILTSNNTLATGVQTFTDPQIPYSTAQIIGSTSTSDNPKVSGRILAVGVRVTYVGTTMNQSGTYTCLAPSSHYNMTVIPGGTAPMDVATLQSDPTVVLEPCDRGWCEMAISPNYPFEFGYSSSSAVSGNSSIINPFSNGSTYINTFTNSAASSTQGAPIAVVAVTGALGGNVFQVEIIQHLEYAGSLVGGLATPSESDEQGGNIVLRAASQMQIVKNATQKKGWPLMYDLLKDAGAAAVQHAVPALVGSLVALL